MFLSRQSFARLNSIVSFSVSIAVSKEWIFLISLSSSAENPASSAS